MENTWKQYGYDMENDSKMISPKKRVEPNRHSLFIIFRKESDIGFPYALFLFNAPFPNHHDYAFAFFSFVPVLYPAELIHLRP